ncbi:ESX secretion-associated protein EspG [Bounagaea algeriensis]
MTQLGRWQLPPVHLDAVLSYLGVEELALPLTTRSHGYTVEQWARAVQAEAGNMAASGVLVDDEIDPNLATALRTLAKPYLWADSIWYPDPEQPHCWRTLAAITEGERGNRVVLGVQTPGEDPQRGGLLTVEVHERVTAAEVLLPTLPPAPKGRQPAVRVPAAELDPARRGERRGEDDEPGGIMRPAASGGRMRSGDRQVQLAKQIAGMPRVRVGQLAVNKRDQLGKRQRSPIVAWFDTPEPDGRYLNRAERGSTGEQLTAFVPADAREIGNQVENMLNQLG